MEKSEEVKELRIKLKSLANYQIASHSKKYLKSPYNFYGVRVPQLRSLAKEYGSIGIYDVYNIFDELWNSGNHEEMELALFILQNHKKKFSLEMWDFLINPQRVEKACTWDHIDYLGTGILGYIVADKMELNPEIKQLSQSENPWMRRLSVVCQCPSIKKGKLQMTLLLAEKLCYDEDIYVQKGTGWMLREAGKKNPVQIKEFVKIHKNMKPTCLSYATEKMLDIRRLVKRMKEEDKSKEQENESTDNLCSSELENIKHFKN